MNILAIVAARGGSKRLPGKNIKLLGGRPLIAWTLEAAKLSGAFHAIVVTTDDLDIANAAQQCGGVMLHRRSAELSTDTATSYDVVMDVLNQYEAANGEVQGVMLLQPTSPFRTTESISRAVHLFGTSKAPVVSVCPAEVHPAWTFRITDSSLDPFLGWDGLAFRSQDLPPAYTLTGSIYLMTPQDLRKHRRFLIPGTQPLITNSGAEALDIDTADDWQAALDHLARQRV